MNAPLDLSKSMSSVYIQQSEIPMVNSISNMKLMTMKGVILL